MGACARFHSQTFGSVSVLPSAITVEAKCTAHLFVPLHTRSPPAWKCNLVVLQKSCPPDLGSCH